MDWRLGKIEIDLTGQNCMLVLLANNNPEFWQIGKFDVLRGLVLYTWFPYTLGSWALGRAFMAISL